MCKVRKRLIFTLQRLVSKLGRFIMFVSFWMTQRLTREINVLEKRLMDRTNQLSNYQKYAGVLGGSSVVSLGNIAGLNSELLPRASMFAQFSDQASSMSAMQNLQAMKYMGRVPYTGNPMVQMQMEMSAFRQFKEQSLKALKQQEINVLNEKEKEIQLDVNSIQQQLSMKRQQLESYKQKAMDDAKQAAPNFG